MKVEYTMARALAVTALAAFPLAAWAHPEHAVGGLTRGLIHPLSGIDHVLAMVGVGVVAAMAGGRARWLVPASFLLMIGVGSVFGAFGLAVPHTELVIAGSVVGIGALVAARLAIPATILMAAISGFALFHGLAHGGEMPVGVAGFAFGAGFVLATAMLHAFGMTLGVLMGRLHARVGPIPNRVAGTTVGATGLMILAQAL